jgi:hypothetical protein
MKLTVSIADLAALSRLDAALIARLRADLERELASASPRDELLDDIARLGRSRPLVRPAS